MSPKKALETLNLVARQYKGSFEEHAHLAECTQILIDLLKSNNLWDESEAKDAE